MASKIERPIIQYSVLCDGVATPKEMANKPVFIGVFSNLRRPMTLPQFYVANRWINGLGEHQQVTKVLDPKLKEIAKTPEVKFSLLTKVHSADIFSSFLNLKFATPGVYWVRIELDGEIALAYPLPVSDEKNRSISAS